MAFSLKELAEHTNSIVKGDKSILINSVAPLQDAEAGQISFISNPKYRKFLNQSNASAIILSPELAKQYAGNALISADPYLTFAKVVFTLNKPTDSISSIHSSAVISNLSIIGANAHISANAVIDENTEIANNVSIGAGCVIGSNCKIEEDAILHANVTLYPGTKIGARSVIHSGAVVGSDGFGFAPKKDKTWYKILQIGNVIIEADVEIGASTTIDCGALGSTIIEQGVKLDNQIQIAHNVIIGAHTVIASGTVIAGSTTIGKHCQIGGAVAIAGHLSVKNDVIITGGSMVVKSILESGVYSSGITADENRKWRRNVAHFKKLDNIAKRIKSLESKHNNSLEK